MTWLLGEWSKLHRVLDRDSNPWFKSCKNRPGLYRLVGLDIAEALTPATLDRVCGHDLSGTIYIGSGGSLPARIAALIKQHDYDRYLSRNHKSLPPRLAEKFPPDKLAVCWRYLHKGVDRYAEERELISAYTRIFGEGPPLNAMP